MVPEYASEMTLYGVPDYVTGANIPKRQWAWERPFTCQSATSGGLDEALTTLDQPKATPDSAQSTTLTDAL